MRSEFDFIQNIKKKFGLDRIGDDCAVLPKDSTTDMLITSDMIVEDIDFRLDWTTPELLGHKSLAVSLSDVAAMGGVPKWALVSIGVPESLWSDDFLDRFYKGWHRLARKSRVELVGGDISRTPEKFVVDSIVVGEVPKGCAILRSGARVGQTVVVTDHVGGSAGGLRLLKSGRRLDCGVESWEEVLLTIHLQPWPQTGTGIYLQDLATSMIDISDGLNSDLKHICDASGVGARIFADKIPINLNLRKLVNTFDEEVDLALNGGEDFQLLFTLPQENIPELAAGMIGGDDYGLFRVIGEITSNTGKIELVQDGRTEIVEPKGYRHF
jgi:thiamine-monophosphate kinase